MSLMVGTKAPHFEGKAYSKGQYKDVKLSDSLGHWTLLYFYPGDFTFVCPTELADLADSYAELVKLDVQVYGISTDSHHVHKAWDDAELSKMIKGGIPYPLLSDAGGAIGRAYGVYDEAEHVDLRGRFLIDPEGILKASEVLVPGVGRNIDETIRQIEAFQYVRSTNGTEVCPARWQRGKAALKKGPDLVSKVHEVWKR